MKSTPTQVASWASGLCLRRAACGLQVVDRSPQWTNAITRKCEMILGWWRDQIQGFDVLSGSDSVHVNEPCMVARAIVVRPAVSSDLSSEEHTPPAKP